MSTLPQTTDQFDFLVGHIYAQWLNANLMPVGAAYDLGAYEKPTIDAETEDKSIPNFITPAGGEWTKLSRTKSVTFKITLFDFNERNLALMRGATFEDVSAIQVTAMPFTAYVGLNPMNSPAGFTPQITYNAIDLTIPVVLTSDDGVQTFNENYDYYVDPTGIHIPPKGAIATLIGASPDKSVPLKITFTTSAVRRGQLWVKSPEFIQLMFRTENIAAGNALGMEIYYKVRIDWTKSHVPVGNDEFGRAELTGAIMPAPHRKMGAYGSDYGITSNPILLGTV